MTQDQARLAQIAAFGFAHGEDPDKLAERLRKYVPAAEQDEIDDALRRGLLAADLAGLAQTGNTVEARKTQESFAREGAQELRILYRARIGPGSDDWRSGELYAPIGADPASFAGLAEEAAIDMLARKRSGELQEGAGNVELIYVAPIG